MDTLIEEGIDCLLGWKPDALVVYCGEISLLKKLRTALPHAPVVAMNAVPHNLVDGIVAASTPELFSLCLEHFSGNGLVNFALLEVVPAEEANAENQFRQLLRDHHGTFSCCNYDVSIEELLQAPKGKALKQIGAWLKRLPKPVGIYCPSTHVAAYLVRVCRHFGLAIPQEIQVIGVDELDESLECTPHLTSIHLPSERIGAAALKMTLKLLAGEKPEPKLKEVEGSSLTPLGSTGVLPSHLSDIPAAIAYIESHATQGITVDDVLRQTQCVCRVTFYHEFKEETGDLPAQYIRHVRIKAACHLLSTTELEIIRVAELSGFSGSSYFAQAFRRDVGMTPSQYRISIKGKE
jgi:AraC-like DNA-binding protein